MKSYKFIKNTKGWFIDLPAYIEQGVSEGDLQMVDGADKMLDMMAGKDFFVVLDVSKEPFEGADMLALIEKCDPYIGGGNYTMKSFEGQEINQIMWLCQVTEFVFADIPQQIFVKRAIA